MGVKRVQLRRKSNHGRDKILCETVFEKAIRNNITYRDPLYKSGEYYIAEVEKTGKKTKVINEKPF